MLVIACALLVLAGALLLAAFWPEENSSESVPVVPISYED